MTRWLVVTVVIVTAWLVHPAGALAATPNIHLVGPNDLLRAGDTVAVTVEVDSAGRVINALDIHLVYSPQYLQVLRVDQSQSVWPLWPEQPQWNNRTGTLSLVAGRPHGLVAINAPVATILFRALGTSLTQVVADATKTGVYLNDGLGTRVGVTGERLDIQLADQLVQAVSLELATTPPPDEWSRTDNIHVRWTPLPDTAYSYVLSQKIEDQPDEIAEQHPGQADFDQLTDGVYFFSIQAKSAGGDWTRVSQYRFLLDQQPPLPFELIPLTASQTSGHPSISWQTTDVTSGVVQARLTVDGRDAGVVTSPWPLKSAWQGKLLKVTVADAAGNTQGATWRVPGSSSPWPLIWPISAAVILGSGLSWMIARRARRLRL